MIKSYKLFTTQFCHKCPAMKEFMAGQSLEGKVVNASEPEGLEDAKKFKVTGVPTVVFLDENGEEVKRSQDTGEIEGILKEL